MSRAHKPSSIDIITRILDQICPIVNIKIRTNTPGWFTPEIIEMINQKRDLTNMLKTSPNDVLFEQLQTCKRRLKKMLRKAKQGVIITSLGDNHTNSRKFWKILNDDLGLSNKSCQDSCTQLRKDDGTMYTGLDLSNFLSNYYASNGKRLAEDIDTTGVVLDEDYFPVACSTFDFQFVPLSVIEKYIRKIDICKSSGILIISSKLMKDALPVLSVELTHIINESISQRSFPDKWALGLVTPIPKGGDPYDPNNWRPITILPIPSKIMERALHYQIINYFENNNYLHHNQHGFRKNVSTATAIFRLTMDLFEAFDSGLSSSCVFVDYRKAFETLDHDLLLLKLRKYGFGEKSVELLSSYLRNRRHIVKCHKSKSSETIVPYGVPQGSILGPALFIVYANDLLFLMEKINGCHIEMYADDTVLYTSNASPVGAMSDMTNYVTILNKWCILNKLTINFKKTKHMLVPRHENDEISVSLNKIKVGDQELENVASYHYLGIDLDKQLNFEKMVDSTFNKANRKLYLLKRIRPFITSSVANRVYKAHILPILDYADFLIDSCTKKKVENLEKVQKRAMHIIDNKAHFGLNYNDLLQLYSLKPLIERRVEHQLCLMYRLSHNSEYVKKHRPTINLRSNAKVKFPTRTTKLTMVLNSPYYRCVRLWDQLPENIQKATSKVKFKLAVKNQ